jgi:hypothetical protein
LAVTCHPTLATFAEKIRSIRLKKRKFDGKALRLTGIGALDPRMRDIGRQWRGFI